MSKPTQRGDGRVSARTQVATTGHENDSSANARAAAAAALGGPPPTAALGGPLLTGAGAAVCRWVASRNLPCAKLPVGLLLTHLRVTSGSMVAEGPKAPARLQTQPLQAVRLGASLCPPLGFSADLRKSWRRAGQRGGRHSQTKPRRTLLHIPRAHYLPGDCWQVPKP